jgi:hypothetical protein
MSNYRGAINSVPYRYRSPYVSAREIIVSGAETSTLVDIFGADLVVNYTAKSVVRSVVNGEDRISQWTDRSGNNYHATQPTSTSCPIYDATGFNGQPVAKFPAPRWMNMPNCLSNSWGQASLFVLYNLNTLANQISIAYMGNSNDAYWGTNSGFGFVSYFGEFRAGRLGGQPGANTISVLGQALVEVISGVGANSYLINRNTSNLLTINPSWSISSTPFIGRDLGATKFANADIAEIAIIKRTPTSGELASMRQYFKNEWALTIY